MLIVEIRHPTGYCRGCNQFDTRIGSLDSIVDSGKTCIVTARTIEEIFIADLDVLDGKGSWMSIRCSYRTPGGAGTAHRILNLIQCILDNLVKCRCTHRDMRPIERVSGIDREQWGEV